MTLSKKIQHKIDQKTKPLGALGQLETLAHQVALRLGTERPELRQPTMLVFAGDHGIAREGVSAYPQEVTWQMVMNFVAGGAAINVFCRQAGMALQVHDAGVNFDFPAGLSIGYHKVAHGTASFLHQAAMTEEQLQQAMTTGARIIDHLAADGCNVVAFGEMGIGNTSAAAMIMQGITGLPLSHCVGRGTGLNDAQYQQKMAVLQAALNHHGSPADPLALMRIFGGLEMAMMLGAMQAAFAHGMVLLIDGFIATAVYAVAHAMEPAMHEAAVFCHQGSEQGHKLLLQHLKAAPLLHLGLRLGEGTGCALAYPLVKSAVAFLNEMASFETAGVSEKTD